MDTSRPEPADDEADDRAPPARERALLSPLSRIRRNSPGGCGAFIGVLLAIGVLALLVQLALRLLHQTTMISLVAFACVGVALLVGAAAVLARPGRATLGPDGLFVRGVTRRAFVPWSRVASVHRDVGDVVVSVDDGRRLRLAVANDWKSVEGYAAFVEVQRARARANDAVGDASALEHLDRRDRPAREWRESLRALLQGGADYRRVWIDPSTLARVLRDGRAPPDRRVAAGLALLDMGEPRAGRMMRLAAADCAEPEMRHALLAAADGEVAAEEIELAEARRRA